MLAKLILLWYTSLKEEQSSKGGRHAMPREIDAVTVERISLGGYKRIGKVISFAASGS